MTECFAHGYALLIGVGRSAYPTWSLPMTVKDVIALQAILENPALCGYPAANIRVLTDDRATRQTILDGLEWLKQQAARDPEATIVVYYSGHGWLDQAQDRYYLVQHDIKPFNLAGSALAAEDFTAALRQIPAERLLVVIDSCHAEGMATAKAGEAGLELPASFVAVAPSKGLFDPLSQQKGRAVFTSCAGTQKSWIRKDQQLSIFTHHLIESLQGAANHSGETTVKVSHLMNHLGKTVATSAMAEYQAAQDPQFDFKTEDFAIALLQGGQRLPAGRWEASSIDELVRILRQNIHPYIQNRCGNMKILDMCAPTDLDAIYTNVNILEESPNRMRKEIRELLDDLLRDVSLRDFDRFSLHNVQEQSIPGLDVVKKYSKLIIFGKPGAGKTTFLKHLAIDCIRGKFQEECLPIFISLKDFAEISQQPDLFRYICEEFFGTNILSQQVNDLERLLQHGRMLILLDGLDEVRDNDTLCLVSSLEKFIRKFHHNRFIITCRIAAKEYIFEQFREVEIADFNDGQIKKFVNNWFRSSDDSIKAKRFLQRLEDSPPIRELAISPILLTLLCLVFQNSGEFPESRSELYKEGLDIFLKKWDASRNIERDKVYADLSLKRKEDLLSKVAYSTFRNGNYFFRQEEIEHQIVQYIRNLPNTNTDPRSLQCDSEAILKSIEAQHGVLVERAKRIYSFSHLTFHEYFTANQISQSFNLSHDGSNPLKDLVHHLTEKRWREVFLLTVSLLQQADYLLILMKNYIDNLLAKDEVLQCFLQWVNEKSQVFIVGNNYKPAAVRAVFLDFDISLDPDRTLGCLLDFSFTRTFACASFLARASDRELNDAFEDIALKVDLTHSHALEPALAITFQRACAINLLPKTILEEESKLGQGLRRLKESLPDFDDNAGEEIKTWWKTKGQKWGDDLREVIVHHRSLGDEWDFNRFDCNQQKLLKDYYYVNSLLVICLNSNDVYIEQEVRQEIEETLLLPVAEIAKRKCEKAE